MLIKTSGGSHGTDQTQLENFFGVTIRRAIEMDRFEQRSSGQALYSSY